MAGSRLKAMDGPAATAEDAGRRCRQPAGRGPRGAAGQRVERLLSPSDPPPDHGVGGVMGDMLDLRLREGRMHTADGAWSSCWRCWSGRSGICAGRPPCGSTRDTPAATSRAPGSASRPTGRSRGPAPGAMPQAWQGGGHLGELMSVVSPTLSSARRPKSHSRGRAVEKREKGVDAFACNRIRLLLAGFGYQIRSCMSSSPCSSA